MGFRSVSSHLESLTAVTTSSTTVPAGVQAGDRVYALVGSGATTALPVTAPSGWTLLGTSNPTSNYTEQLYYRDVASPSEAGTTVTWTWSNTSRTWIELVAYSGVDTSRAPAFNVATYAATSAGPFNAPTVVVPDSDWLLTFASGRESPGTDTVKTLSINAGTDAKRDETTSANLGTGQKFVVAVFDSAGTLTTTGGGGGVDVGPQAPPTNSFNKIVTSATPFKVGATMKKEELDYWKPKLAGNQIMRIFPDKATLLPPDWGDSRFGFIKSFGGDPFISSKCDGDNAKISALITFLKAMPAWILNDPDRTLWFTDHHEPEGEVTATNYKANFLEVWNALNDSSRLPANIRAKMQVGPVLTRQYTENTAGRTYTTFDPGVGQFFGVDMYMNSWSSTNPGAVATTFVNAVTFLSRFKAYTYDNLPASSTTDHRPRMFPELGAIGIPNDPDGTLRAAWIQAVHDQLLTWTTAAQGWPFIGWIFWNAEGKAGDPVKGNLTGAGIHRWFNFDRRHNGQKYDVDGDPQGGYDLIPSVAATTGGGGSTASARTVSTNVPVTQAHIWSVTIPMVPPVVVDPTTVNAWSNLGLPQR